MSRRKRNNRDIQAWTRYWQTADPSVAGCLPGLPSKVSAKFEELWSDFFSRLPPGAAVLDLGTGSGTVLRLARSVASGLKLTGVDYADVLPSPGQDIRMMSAVRLEDLPFADESFDAVSSQFAFEYADQLSAVAELQRVLAPAGTLLIVAHHASSVIVAHNDRRLRVLREITGKGGLIDQATALIKRGRQQDRSGHIRLSRLLGHLRQAYPEQGLVNDVAGVMAQIMAEPDALKPLRVLGTELTYEIERLKALRSAALTDAQAHALADRIAATHANVLSVINVPGESTPLAWSIASPPT